VEEADGPEDSEGLKMLNPFTTIPKLIKSEPLIDGLEKDLKTMNKSNWKTNTVGAIALIIGLAQLWAPANLQAKIQQTAVVLTGAGLLAARDNNNK
jgi:hypothetical protein